MILMRFAMSLLPKFKSIPTVGQHVSMVRSRHRQRTGVDIILDHAAPRLKLCLKSLGDLFPIQRKERHPVRTQQFALWQSKVDWYGPDWLQYAVAFELAFNGLLRSIEWCSKTASGWATHPHKLSRGHVKFVPSLAAPKFCIVYVVPAKAGGTINHYNNRNPLVLKFDSTAPVNACRALRALFLNDPVPDRLRPKTPLFRLARQRGQPPIAYKQFLAKFRQLIALDRNEVPTRYGLHSFRIGGATALLAAGCSKEQIQAMGRWSSDIYMLYARSNVPDLLKWSGLMGRQPVHPTEVTALLLQHDLPAQDTDRWSANLDADLLDPADDTDDDDL
mmetsp:Transcript_10657/g.32052  ORF Transcript_10657/g.32052 Transcript_10657/m.32052 type:complete len:333 (+) Transcript_10657:314-1312(+)